MGSKELYDKLLSEKRKVVIYGLGNRAKQVASLLRLDANVFRVRCFFDGNRERAAAYAENGWYNLPVFSSDTITDFSEYFFIVAVNNGYQEIRLFLEQHGLKEDVDFVHWEKLDTKIILGISALYHDSAAAITVNGEIIAAAQEERFTRKKHDASFPKNAIRYCMEVAGLDFGDLDGIIYYDNPFLTTDRLLSSIVSAGDEDKGLRERNLRSLLNDKLWIHKKIAGLADDYIPKDKIYVCEHHVSHAASAFFPSPFREAAILTFDGVGEWATATIGVGCGNKITMLREIDYPHSVGLLYSAFTYFCGFKVNSGEYKLMGLAPYGHPIYADMIKKYIVEIQEDGAFRLNLDYFGFQFGGNMTNERFAELFGGDARKPETPITQREMDLAASIQAVTEEIILKVARYTKTLTGMKNICLAGGIALNCVANGKLLRSGLFENVWIQPAAGDAGGAIGAAQYLYYDVWDRGRFCLDGKDSMCGAFLGPQFSQEDICSYLNRNGLQYHDFYGRDQDFYLEIAKFIEDGKVCGLFQGRMEFGPRALGSRSIIADARNSQMQSKLNTKIKFRESFRPFAPAVLAEDCEKYFDLRAESPYMLLTADVKEELRQESKGALDIMERVREIRSTIPAVTHVDYSARVQTVAKDLNPEFYNIIEAFKKRTGCSVIVNTSFNVRGEPIVCTPEDAYNCFMATDMDVLILGKCILMKEEQTIRKEDRERRHAYAPD